MRQTGMASAVCVRLAWAQRQHKVQCESHRDSLLETNHQFYNLRFLKKSSLTMKWGDVLLSVAHKLGYAAYFPNSQGSICKHRRNVLNDQCKFASPVYTLQIPSNYYHNSKTALGE